MTMSFDTSESRGAVRYLEAFRAHWLLILALTVLAVGAAEIVTQTATKRYQTSADIQIQALPAFGGDPFQGFDLFRQSADGSSPAVAAARVFGSPAFSDAYRASLGARAKAVHISVTPLQQADIVSISASGSNPRLVAIAANRFVKIIISQRKTLFQRELVRKMQQISAQLAAIPKDARSGNPTYQQLAGELGTLRAWIGSNDPTAQVLTDATVPSAASWPRPKLTLAVALVVGLLLGAACAVALELVNPRLMREDELALQQRLPILTRIPRISARTAHDYLLGRALLPADMWRGYRTLRAVLANAGLDGGYPRSILVTSASPGDAKTMTAVNIAIALASSNLRVTLVDADFHRPMVGSIFNVTTRHDGLVRLLANPDAPNTGAVDAPTHARLKLLLSSREQLHQLDLLDTKRFEKMLERLQRDTDVVVIDSPPVPEVAEALALTNAVEAVIVCVRIGHTRRDKLNELRRLLARRGVTPLGLVVTSRDRPQLTSTDYDYATGMTTTPTSSLGPQREKEGGVSR